MKEQLSWLVILSAYHTGGKGYLNEVHHAEMGATLRQAGISFSEGVGVYRGEEEKNFIVTLPNPVDSNHKRNLDILLGLARLFQQDSIFVRDNEGFCELHNPYSKDTLPVGRWREVRDGETPENSTTFNGKTFTAD